MTAETLKRLADLALIDEESGEAPWRRATRHLLGGARQSAGLARSYDFFIALAISAAPLASPYDPIATNWATVRKAPLPAAPLRHRRARPRRHGAGHLGCARLAPGGACLGSLALAVGVPIGLLTGYVGGIVDGTVMRLIDAMLAIPFLILAIALAAFLGPSLSNAMIAIGISQTPIFARLTRGQVLSVKHEDYVEAARALGNPRRRIVLAPLSFRISCRRCWCRRRWPPPTAIIA